MRRVDSIGHGFNNPYPLVETMQLAFAVIVVLWWIAIWGLSDLLTENWSRESKAKLYIALLVFVGLVVWSFPNIVRRF